MITPLYGQLCPLTQSRGGLPARWNGIVSCWHLEETSGSRVDAVGSNTLTESAVSTGYGTGLLGTNAAKFDLNANQYLYCNDNATIRSGDFNFAWSAWVNPTTLPGYWTPFGKWDGLNKREWAALGIGTKISLYYMKGGVQFGPFEAPTVLSVGAWALLFVWYDATADTFNLQVNNGTIATASLAGGPDATAGRFTLGVHDGGTSPMNGLLDECLHWKTTIPSAADRTAIYNGGSGLAYPN